MWLQIRFLAVGSAIGAYVVWRLAVIHRWLQRESDNASTDIGKLIPLLISFPVFKTSHFLFKVTYTINKRRLRFLCKEDFFLAVL